MKPLLQDDKENTQRETLNGILVILSELPHRERRISQVEATKSQRSQQFEVRPPMILQSHETAPSG
jgi:hypothetical protein